MRTSALPPEQVVEKVRERYGKIASGELAGCGCACNETDAERVIAAEIGYGSTELESLPEESNLGLGCGAPIQHLELATGETVVDLGSGAGIDAFLAARLVGATGRVIGIDMTPEMLDKARAVAAKHGFTNVEFRAGRLEQLPVEDGTVDAITSNCVINLVPDKGAVFREAARVLKPGGRMVVSDILLDGELPDALAEDILAWTGCVSGAERREAYLARLDAAGFGEIEILRDVDYAASLAKAAPEEADALLGRLGLKLDDLRGVVRSVTYRATKPAADAPCCGTDCCSSAAG